MFNNVILVSTHSSGVHVKFVTMTYPRDVIIIRHEVPKKGIFKEK